MGTFRFQHRLLCISNPLKGRRIGLDEVDDGYGRSTSTTSLLAKLDERDYIIRGKSHVSPVFLDNSVTYVPGPRLLTV